MFMRNCLLFFLVSYSCLLGADESGPGLGVMAPAKLIKQWNTDIFPDGEGLPAGRGSVTQGEKIYAVHCQGCHGIKGEGGSAEELAGARHALTDDPPDKTIGTYWPYATTLFDFIRRSMPLNEPGRLSNSQVYAVTAYLLYLNRIVNVENEMDARTLPKIIMPNRDGFIDAYSQAK